MKTDKFNHQGNTLTYKAIGSSTKNLNAYNFSFNV